MTEIRRLQSARVRNAPKDASRRAELARGDIRDRRFRARSSVRPRARGQQHLGDSLPDVEAAGRPDLGTRVVRFLSYLTIWFNVLVAGTCALLALDPERDGRIWRVLRLNAVVIAAVGGIVHWFLLRPLLNLHGANYLADKPLHVAVPLLTVIGWIGFGPRGRLDRRDLAEFLIVPLAWLANTLVRGAMVGWYPYPFVDVDQLGYVVVGATFWRSAGRWWRSRSVVCGSIAGCQMPASVPADGLRGRMIALRSTDHDGRPFVLAVGVLTEHIAFGEVSRHYAAPDSLRTDRQEQERAEQREMHAGLQQSRAARDDREHGDDAGQRQQHDVHRFKPQDQRHRQPHRRHGDGRNGQTDARHRRTEGEVETDLHPTHGAAARTAASVSGSSTSSAMITPTTASGRPAAETARSIIGDTSLASPTTATSASNSRPRLTRAVRVGGGSACWSTSVGVPHA